MNSLDDLRSALRDLESEAPDAAEILARAGVRATGPTAATTVQATTARTRPTRRSLGRRIALPATAAAAVAAGAVALATLGPGHDPTGSPPAATRPAPSVSASTAPTSSTTPTKPTVSRPDPVALEWTFAVDDVPGYDIVRYQIAASFQAASISIPGANKDIGSLTVYPQPGVVPGDVRPALSGERVRVGPVTGHFRMVARKALLAWPTAGGGWALIEGDWDAGAARAAELSIARATDTSARDAVGLDFGVAYLPETLSVAGTTFTPDFGGRPHLQLDLVDDLPGQEVPDGQRTPAVIIQRGAPPQDNGQPGTETFHRNTTINGRPADYSDTRPYRGISIKFPGNTVIDVIVDETHYDRYSKADVLRIARSLTPVGDPAKPGTWKPADTLLPR